MNKRYTVINGSIVWFPYPKAIDNDKPHKKEDCPYLHVKKCKGCGRSCGCYSKRKKKVLRTGKVIWIHE